MHLQARVAHILFLAVEPKLVRLIRRIGTNRRCRLHVILAQRHTVSRHGRPAVSDTDSTISTAEPERSVRGQIQGDISLPPVLYDRNVHRCCARYFHRPGHALALSSILNKKTGANNGDWSATIRPFKGATIRKPTETDHKIRQIRPKRAFGIAASRQTQIADPPTRCMHDAQKRDAMDGAALMDDSEFTQLQQVCIIFLLTELCTRN